MNNVPLYIAAVAFSLAGLIHSRAQAEGKYCREFSQGFTIAGEAQEGYGTACRQPDGRWKIVKPATLEPQQIDRVIIKEQPIKNVLIAPGPRYRSSVYYSPWWRYNHHYGRHHHRPHSGLSITVASGDHEYIGFGNGVRYGRDRHKCRGHSCKHRFWH